MSLGLGPISSLPISAIPSPTAALTAEETSSAPQPFIDDTAPTLSPGIEEFVATTASLSSDEQATQKPILVDDLTLSFVVSEDFVSTVSALVEDSSPVSLQPDEQTVWPVPASEDFGGSHPTEEAASFQPLALDERPVGWPVPEDFAGIFTIDEASLFALASRDDLAVTASSPGEEFVGELPVEDASPLRWSPLDEPSWVYPVAEDFVGPLPIDEPSTFTSLVLDDLAAAATPVGEDFAGSMPFEDSPPLRWAPSDEPSWVYPVAEDFVGPLPIDEPSTFTSLVLDDLAAAATPVGEDFAGSMPFEDSPPLRWAPSDEPSWVYPVAEDFVGPLPIDEPSTFTSLVLDDLAAAATPVSEDFAGSMPFEDSPPLRWAPSDEPSWVYPVAEDFVGPLPIDEPSTFTSLVLDDLAAAATPVSEDFAGSMPFEDSPPFRWAPSDDPSWVALVPEEFAGALPVEEASAFTPPTLSPQRALLATIAEDIVSAILTEDPSPFLAPQHVDSTWVAIASEEFAVAVVVDETPAAMPATALYEPTWLTPKPEEFVSSNAPDEGSGFLWVQPHTPVWLSVAVSEDIASGVVFTGDEPPAPQSISRPDALLQISISSEEFVLSVPVFDESSPLPALRTRAPRPSAASTGEEFVPRVIPPPPPPPPPEPPTSGGQYRNMDWEWRRRLAEMEARATPDWGGPDVTASIHRPGFIEDASPEQVAEIVGKANYVLMPTGDGLEVTAFAAGVLHQFRHTEDSLCALLKADNGVAYLYVRMRTVFGPTGRRVKQGEPIGLSGGQPLTDYVPADRERASGLGVQMPGVVVASQLPPKRDGFGSWTSADWVRHYAARWTAESTSTMTRALVDPTRWRRSPESQARSPAALLAVLALPLMLMAPASGIIMALAALFALGSRDRRAPQEDHRPVTGFAWHGDRDEDALTVEPESWLIVTMPLPVTGTTYECSGHAAPLSTNMTLSVRSVGLSSFALPIGSGAGTVAFRLVRSSDRDHIRTYRLRLTTDQNHRT